MPAHLKIKYIAYSMSMYVFRAHWVFLGFPRPFRGSLGPFKAYSRLFRKKLTLFCMKNSNSEYWVSEKTIIGKIETPGCDGCDKYQVYPTLTLTQKAS